MNNYQLTVPVFTHYLQQLDKLLDKVSLFIAEQAIDERELLDLHFQKDMLPLAQQINVAVNFAIRGCLPLAGKPMPTPYYERTSLAAVQDNLQTVLKSLQALTEEEFIAAAISSLDIQPGKAANKQTLSSNAYIQLYALPNFFFHWSMTYALLRQYGMSIGKNDFDGLHQFPPGFSFMK